MSAHTELEGRPVTLNEQGNDHVESLQAEAGEADEAASGEDGLTRVAVEALHGEHDRDAYYRRQRALELAVDVHRAGFSVTNIPALARDFDLFLQGKMTFGGDDAQG